MTKKVVFYQENTKSLAELLQDALINAIYAKELILITCNDENQAKQISDLLYNSTRFLAHNLSGEITKFPTPIEINWHNKHPNAQARNLIINLQDNVPELVFSFTKAIDFVPKEEQGKALARMRYKEYRKLNWQTFVES